MQVFFGIDKEGTVWKGAIKLSGFGNHAFRNIHAVTLPEMHCQGPSQSSNTTSKVQRQFSAQGVPKVHGRFHHLSNFLIPNREELTYVPLAKLALWIG